MLLVGTNLPGALWQALEVGLLQTIGGGHKDAQVLSLQVGRLLLCWASA